MIGLKHCLMATAGLAMLTTAVARLNALDTDRSSPNGAVHALFDPDHPDTGPFPSDVFTVVDPRHNTGPGCSLSLDRARRAAPDRDVLRVRRHGGRSPRTCTFLRDAFRGPLPEGLNYIR